MPEVISVIFFDLGDTLGSAVLSPPPVRLVGFDVYPFVPEMLSGLQNRGIRLGIISNTGDDGSATVDAVLETAAILRYFDPALRLYSHDVGLRKDSAAIFARAAQLAELGGTPEQCLYVGEDSAERGFAMQAGLHVCSHPLMIGEVIEG